VVDISEFGRKAEKEKFIIALIKKKVRDIEGVGKVVVYYNLMEKVEIIAGALGYNTFYYNMVGKKVILDDFRIGKR